MAVVQPVACVCEQRLAGLIQAVESGAIDKAIVGALRAASTDHAEIAFRPSIAKRVRAAVKQRLHELTDVRQPARFDPYRKHCPTCECAYDVVQRTQCPGSLRSRGGGMSQPRERGDSVNDTEKPEGEQPEDKQPEGEKPPSE